MTLRRRLSRQIALMVAGVGLLGAAAVWGLMGLHQDFGVALRANEQVRDVYEVGVHVATARSALDTGSGTPARGLLELRRAQAMLATRRAGGRWLESTRPEADAVDAALQRAITRLSPGNDPAGPLTVPDAAAIIAEPYNALANLSAATRQAILARQTAADQRHQRTLAVVVLLASAVVVFAVVVGWRQYRGVMRPLAEVQAATQRMAAGRLDQRINVRGDREFASLAGDFNRMAAELQDLYRDLEQRVAVKSRQLVRSERLASVGFLAAGVAHEINNPLGIITGYGERSLQRLERATDPETTAYVRKALGVICEEAFRCKRITDHLLLLARPGGEGRRPVALTAVASAVVTSVQELPRFVGRQITLLAESDVPAAVIGNEGELRQVVLNLVVNALEAVSAETGHVRIDVREAGTMIELAVSDNGRGMSPDVRSRVFEPFFTDKRGSSPGTGLGLSVAHAIVQDHGGTLEAHSDGPGHGSRFVVHLPAAEKEDEISGD